MKPTSVLFKCLLTLAAACCIGGTAMAQSNTPLPQCSGRGAGLVYFATLTGDIYRLDPAAPGTPMITGITLPFGSQALAVSRNLNGGLTTPTYYTTVLSGGFRYIAFWDAVLGAWQTTAHSMPADHIAGGGGFIFGLDTVSGYVFRYNGTGSSAYIANVGAPPVGSSRDIAGDCSGNFYILYQTAATSTSIPSLRKYSSSGTLLNTYTITGTAPNGSGGLAINGNNVFYDGADGKLYSGVISGSTISFSASAATPFSSLPVADFGACGYAGLGNTTYGKDTVKACNGATNVTLTATGPGPYNWTVLSGPATINGTGSSVIVNATGTSVLTVNDADCSGSNTLVDTIIIFVANATVDVGPDITLGGCHGDYNDTICMKLTNTTSGISYGMQWYPFNIILGTSTDTCVNIVPTGNNGDTIHLIAEVTTLSGCIFRDSLIVTLADSTPTANFTYVKRLGCDQDTVQFFNTSSPSRLIDSIAWDFDDGSNISNAVSPQHIYTSQNFYNVFLLVSNKFCTDTVRKGLDLFHSNDPAFIVDDSTVCTGTIVVFTNKSQVAPTLNPRFFYIFGDGTTSNLANPTHIFRRPGNYNVALVLSNSLGCSDTFRKLIVVDSVPFARLTTTDTVICEGQAIHLVGQFLSVGSTGTTIDLGDGTVFQNTNSLTYAFEHAGPQTVKFTAHYRICPDTTDSVTYIVHPYPGVNLGPDTVLCPNGAPLVLSDRINAGNPAAKFLWNTGETTSAIFARENGTYWVRATVAGCSGTDSVMVNKDCYLDIPNAFTPNGANPYFIPRQSLSRSLNQFHMTIYNRWGQIVYETRALNGRGWDGKFNGTDQPQDVYVYMIDLTFDNGVKEHYTGNVTLIR